MQDYFVCSELLIRADLSSGRALGLAFRCVLGRRHDPAGDLPHMLSGIGKLTLQELRLNLHGLLKIGGVNQFSRMIERSLHILLGEL